MQEITPFAQLQRLLAGEWHFVSGTLDDPPIRVHRYEVGQEGALLMLRSFDRAGAGARQVATALWYWHPVEGVIKSLGIASFEADTSLYECSRVEVDGNQVRCEQTTSGAQGQRDYIEEWQFEGRRYDWTLYAVTPEGPQPLFSTTFERRNP